MQKVNILNNFEFGFTYPQGIYTYMAMSPEISENYELTKNHVLQSDLPDSDKNTALKLLNICALATNGISMEEKIQKMSESVFSLISWQMKFLTSINAIVENQTKKEYLTHCKECKGYKHAVEVEKEKEQQELLDAYLKTMGIRKPLKEQRDSLNDNMSQIPHSFCDTIKMILLKPYPYIFLSIAVFSPFIVDILKLIFSRF